MIYDDSFDNPRSKSYLEAAENVERELLTVFQINITNIVAVRVNSITNSSGNVVVDIYLVMNASEPKLSDTPYLIKQSVDTAAKDTNLTLLHIDSSFKHEISGTIFTMIFPVEIRIF